MIRAVLPLLMLCSFGVLSACEPVPEERAASFEDSLLVATRAAERDDDYRVVLRGLLPDTLSGSARFGPVVDGRTGQEMTVVRLERGLDFGGGFFILHPGRRLPGPGTYSIGAPLPDSVRALRLPPGFTISYRRGLVIDLNATSGTLTLRQVSDTLIAGSFEAVLEGMVAPQGGRPQQGTLQAEGEFSARADGAGYIIGL